MIQLDARLGRMVIASLLSMSLASAALADTFHYLPETEIVDLNPQIRVEPFSVALYTVNSDQMAMYLQDVLIFDTVDDYQMLPYIVGFNHNNNMGFVGSLAFTKGISIKKDISEFSILTSGRILRHPVSDEELGLQAFVIGTAIVEKFADPQTLLITKSIMDVQINSRLVPLVGINLPFLLEVKYPNKAMTGYILAMEQDHFGGGGFTPVVISLGKRDGLKKGNVLNITEDPRIVTDPNTSDKVTFPIEKIGEVLVYKVGEKISLGIITYSDRLILPKDKVSITEQDINEKPPQPGKLVGFISLCRYWAKKISKLSAV